MITVIHGRTVVEINATCTLDSRAFIVTIELSYVSGNLYQF